ncbi:MAG: hypothetical protein JWM69_1332 [Candidatus Binatus sp.]|jgi:hypothetical protein|nr:hypothetical protein [Candidatus Binatus sp.]
MNVAPKSQSNSQPWPFDLKVFASLAGLWAICLLISAFFHEGDAALGDPLQAIFAGVRFEDEQARLVLVVEAVIFGSMSVGILLRQRWALLLAVAYMVEVVLSHLTFVIAYLPIRAEWQTVRMVAMQGPMLVLITLYLWIRSSEIIFNPRPLEPANKVAPEHPVAVSTDPHNGAVEAPRLL